MLCLKLPDSNLSSHIVFGFFTQVIVYPFATVSTIIGVTVGVLCRSIVKDQRGENTTSKRGSVMTWGFGLSRGGWDWEHFFLQ